MINLLDSTMTAQELEPLLRRPFRRPMLPPLDAPAWKAAGEKPAVRKWMEGIEAQAEKEVSEPMPPLTDELYAFFHKTGNRLTFEVVYNARRRILARAAMAVLCGDTGKRNTFVPSLLRKIGEIMDEESWSLPAHVWTEPTGKNPLMIDLAAAETANLMGELLTLFGALIPEDLARRIRERLRVQVFENYLRRHAEFTWTGLPMNWNAVCHQGVLGAALAVENAAPVVTAMLVLAGRYLRTFLGGFGGDGSTSEGPGYWSYGFGRFAELNEQLETATGGALSVFGANEHIARIAKFAPALAFSNRHLVNFSDGDHRGALSAPLLAYLGERLRLPALSAEAVALYRSLAETGIDLPGQRCDLFTLARTFLRCPEPEAMEKAVEPARPDAYFQSYGAVVARGKDAAGNLWEFAAKGGHNDEHHNHNDCGSFILNLNGGRAIIEIGAPEYVHGFFGSERRYTFLAARSLGHSVPFVNGFEQAAGPAFTASVLACELQRDRVKFVVDLTRCYPAAAGCRKLVRTFLLEKSAGLLTVADAFEFEEPGVLESILICEAPVKPKSRAVRLNAPGGALMIVPSGSALFSNAEVCEYNDHDGKPRQVNRLRFRHERAALSGVVQYQVRRK